MASYLTDKKKRSLQIHHLVWYEDGRGMKEKNYANKLTPSMQYGKFI